jgi:cell division protein FtsI/penicillin-binding protein 2
MQIARMVSSIFTGSLINPRILASEPIVKQPLAIKLETRKFLQQSMKSTITQGTGSRVKQVKDIVMYAKTSTAQTVALDSHAANMQHHGWFAGYFYYGNHTPLTIVILIEHAGSSLVATTMAKEFLIRYKRVMDAHTETRGTL